MAEGLNFWHNFGHVIDGTKCSPDKRDVCIEGKCVAVGCDMKIGSDLVEDMCR